MCIVYLQPELDLTFLGSVYIFKTLPVKLDKIIDYIMYYPKIATEI